eukprot:TRINITY_DN8680_c0_g1_i1.p1 TRINITY_DN8680_c0_g1~~TRINITY_DN8680_c0_g1_i1.p1  ORF type:complete len:318 (-),score=80.37 TRINITY_DN8680_c0_g1_i1:156-1109(-)
MSGRGKGGRGLGGCYFSYAQPGDVISINNHPIGVPLSPYKGKTRGVHTIEKALEPDHSTPRKKLLWSSSVATAQSTPLPDVTRLFHGDVIDFGGYRGVGTYLLYKTKVRHGDSIFDDFILIKALEEYGYGLPFEFMDAPLEYYGRASSSINKKWIDPDHIIPPLPEKHDLERKFREYEDGEAPDAETDWEPSDPKSVRSNKVLAVKEEHGGIDLVSCEDLDIMLREDYVDFLERFKIRKEAFERSTKLILRILFRDVFPHDVIDLVSAFVVQGVFINGSTAKMKLLPSLNEDEIEEEEEESDEAEELEPSRKISRQL